MPIQDTPGVAQHTQSMIIAGLLMAMTADELDAYLLDRCRRDLLIVEIRVGLTTTYGWQRDRGHLVFFAASDTPQEYVERIRDVLDLDDPAPLSLLEDIPS